MAKPRIATILVHYNTEEETRQCLESLSTLDTKTFEHHVYVVDNGSKEQLQLSERVLNQGVTLIRSQSNLGFTGGNNLGIRYALDHSAPEYLFLLNTDTLIEPQALRLLLKELDDHLDVGMASPMIYFAPGFEFHHDDYTKEERGKVIWYAGGSIDWPNLADFHRGVDEIDRGQFATQTTSDFATGCAVLIKREVVERVGLFDNRFFLYNEDTDFSMRVLRAGYGLSFVPNAIVWHKNAGSSGGSGSRLHQYYQTRNRLLFGMKHGSWRLRITVLRFALRLLTSGNDVERKAAWHALTFQFGKEVAI